MDRNDEKNEILAALALGALDERTARAESLAAEIASDPELAAELEAWNEVAASLALAAPPAEPSSAVRENILAAIRKTPQNSENGAPVHIRPVKAADAPIPSADAPQTSNVVPFPGRSANRTFWSYTPVYGALAASIIALILAVSLYNAVQNNRNQNTRLAELNQKLSQAEQKLTDAQAQLDRERQERELLASPASAVFSLAGTENAATAKARLVFDPQTGKAYLYVEGLPDAPAGKAYQIWWITDPTKPAPGGTFKTGQNGKGILTDQIPAQFTKAQIFAVTLEPEGGSQAPTSPPYLITQKL